MKKYWWKIACMALLFYVLLAGTFIPLGPGISLVHPEKVAAGDTLTFYIKGYNSHFDHGTCPPSVWFANAGKSICAQSVQIRNRTELEATIAIPADVKSRNFNLFVNSCYDGTMVLNNAIMLAGDMNNNATPTTGCEVTVATNSAGFHNFPNREILYESIRNLFYHVPMWWTMMLLFTISLIYSVGYLAGFNLGRDRIAGEAARVGIVFGVLGLLTGMVWAKFTWGAWWVSDVRLNGSAATLLAYTAYIVLRNSMNEEQKRARIAAVYNIFAYMLMLVLIIIIPRLTDSLHPGSGGNPGFSSYDLDHNLRLVFYPAAIGWMLLGVWILQIRNRKAKLFPK